MTKGGVGERERLLAQYAEACNFPGVLDEAAVERALRRYLAARGIRRDVRRRGAQPWVGRAKWHFGSFYLWGDVPALMPTASRGAMKMGVTHRSDGQTCFRREGRVPTDPARGVKGFTSRRLGKNEVGRMYGSKSPGRKMVSAMIAKIPFPLASHIAWSMRAYDEKGRGR